MSTGKVFTGTDMETGASTEDATPDNTSETVDDTGTTEEGSTETEDSTPTVEELLAENKKLQDRYENANQVIGRHSQELHDLRTFKTSAEQSPKDEKVTSEDYLNDFVKNPQEALAKELDKRENVAKQQKEYQDNIATQNSNYVYQQVPAMDNLKDTILELAREDGIENPTLKMLNDTISTDPLLAVSYAKRAVQKQQYDELKNNGKSTIEKIAKNSKKAPVTKSTSKAKEGDLTGSDIRNMSSDDINARLKELNFYG